MEIEPPIRTLMDQLKKISKDPEARELARLREKAEHVQLVIETRAMLRRKG